MIVTWHWLGRQQPFYCYLYLSCVHVTFDGHWVEVKMPIIPALSLSWVYILNCMRQPRSAPVAHVIHDSPIYTSAKTFIHYILVPLNHCMGTEHEIVWLVHQSIQQRFNHCPHLASYNLVTICQAATSFQSSSQLAMQTFIYMKYGLCQVMSAKDATSRSQPFKEIKNYSTSWS